VDDGVIYVQKLKGFVVVRGGGVCFMSGIYECHCISLMFFVGDICRVDWASGKLLHSKSTVVTMNLMNSERFLFQITIICSHIDVKLFKL
jgi:hypothetical protein